MRAAEIKNGAVANIANVDPKKIPAGYVEVDKTVQINWLYDGHTFSAPTIDRKISDVTEHIWQYQTALLISGIIFDGFRHGGDGRHREYVATQYNIIRAGVSGQFGTKLRDSDGSDQPMDDAKLCALYENGADYISKINQAAMAAEDSLKALTQAQLNSFDPATDIIWPTNIYAYP